MRNKIPRVPLTEQVRIRQVRCDLFFAPDGQYGYTASITIINPFNLSIYLTGVWYCEKTVNFLMKWPTD